MTPDNSTSGISGNGVTSYTLSHTTGTGTNRLMIVMVGINAPADRISAATYAGVAMTRADYRNVGGVGIYAYFLYAPTSGANNLVLTFSSGTKCYVQVHTFSDAPQSGVPSATAGGANGFQNSPRSDSITTPTGGVAVGAIFSADALDFAVSGSGTEVGAAATDPTGRLETQRLLNATAIAWTWASGQKNMAATVMALPAGPGAGADLTGSLTLDAVDPTGTLGLNPSTLTGSVTLDAVAPTGTLGIAPGQVTTLPFARNTGSRPTGLTAVAAAILSDDANMTRLAGATSLNQDGAGRITYTGAGLPSVGTSVLVVTREPDGKLGVERYTVA